MSSKEATSKEGDPHHHHPPPSQPQYGTFHSPAMGFPQPAPPPGVLHSPSAPPLHGNAGDPAPPNPYYVHGYQAVPGYAAVVAEGRPVRERRLPCCGIGMGWFLFIIGFFLAAIPWYVGAIIMLCSRVDYREKPGFIACTIAAVIAAIVVILGVTKGADGW